MVLWLGPFLRTLKAVLAVYREPGPAVLLARDLRPRRVYIYRFSTSYWFGCNLCTTP